MATITDVHDARQTAGALSGFVRLLGFRLILL
jgi:hypothetical protein